MHNDRYVKLMAEVEARRQARQEARKGDPASPTDPAPDPAPDPGPGGAPPLLEPLRHAEIPFVGPPIPEFQVGPPVVSRETMPDGIRHLSLVAGLEAGVVDVDELMGRELDGSSPTAGRRAKRLLLIRLMRRWDKVMSVLDDERVDQRVRVELYLRALKVVGDMERPTTGGGVPKAKKGRPEPGHVRVNRGPRRAG